LSGQESAGVPGFLRKSAVFGRIWRLEENLRSELQGFAGLRQMPSAPINSYKLMGILTFTLLKLADTLLKSSDTLLK
jgi:hypothetical protein